MFFPAHIYERENNSDETTVKGEAAVPDFDDFKRVLKVEAEIVEEHVAESPAENDAQEYREEKIDNEVFFYLEFALADESRDEKIGNYERQNVHESIPADA
jgi:hypothetical protein